MSKRSNCKKPKCQNVRTAKSPNVKTLELQNARMSKWSNCKKPECQRGRTAKSPNAKAVELQKAQMSKRSNCKKPKCQNVKRSNCKKPKCQNARTARSPKYWENSKSDTRIFFVELGICFLHFRLKRIVLNFQPDRSHPRRVNDLPKNRKNPKTDTRKKKSS